MCLEVAMMVEGEEMAMRRKKMMARKAPPRGPIDPNNFNSLQQMDGSLSPLLVFIYKFVFYFCAFCSLKNSTNSIIHPFIFVEI